MLRCIFSCIFHRGNGNVALTRANFAALYVSITINMLVARARPHAYAWRPLVRQPRVPLNKIRPNRPRFRSLKLPTFLCCANHATVLFFSLFFFFLLYLCLFFQRRIGFTVAGWKLLSFMLLCFHGCSDDSSSVLL